MEVVSSASGRWSLFASVYFNWIIIQLKASMKTLLKIAVLILAVLLPSSIKAQYSQDAFTLKSLQDTYDERGYTKGSAMSVDGKLAISNQNGTPSYVYPISSFTSGGHQVNVALSYAGSVQFTCFKDYNLSNRFQGGAYDGWSRFHQNRPAWIMSVNNWAINMFAGVHHFHGDPSWPLDALQHTDYDDRHALWLADGFDFCNRMRDFGAVASSEDYRDVIRILRGDGSVLELLNVHRRGDINFTNPDSVAWLYTGTYYSNEPNSHGYGVVEFDINSSSQPVGQKIIEAAAYDYRYPLYPRKLRYFPGDGTEVIFRERLDPFGFLAYTAEEGRSGGYWGHPSIFYIEQIRGSGGVIVDFTRTRHYPQFGGAFTGVPDVSRGRAPITSFTGHEIRMGNRSVVVEAMGRTTKIRFDSVMQSGNAVSGERMPYATLGGATGEAWEMGYMEETDPRLYKGFLAQVTQIIDPEDRVTNFGYETYTKRYRNFGYPRSSTSGNITIALKNHRLTTIHEPAARYRLTYYESRDELITQGQLTYAKELNNMVDTVRKTDRYGVPLVTDRYIFPDASEVGAITISTQITKDHVTGHERQIDFTYDTYTLSTYIPILTPGRHTVLTQTIEKAGPLTTTTNTSYAAAVNVPAWGGNGSYTVLPVSQVTLVNGVAKSHQEFYYELDTLRQLWTDTDLSAKFGMEITRKVTRTMKPDEPARVLLVDTTTYRHLPRLDTTLTFTQAGWDKFKTLANFFYLRDTVRDPVVVGKRWEDVSFRAPVAVFDVDTLTEELSMPPLFGLAERSWITDTTGAVTGSRNVYVTDVLEAGQRTLRGKLVADSVLGSDGKRLLKGSYTFRRDWTGDLPASTTNALGVPTLFSYGYSFCDDVPFWEECTFSEPVATIVANDGTTREHTMEWSPYSWWFAKPAAERRYVRRYDAFGALHRDTLTAYTERTFHGQGAGVMDPNGYYSKYDYDYNGRLNTAWLPWDFAGQGILDTFSYEGPEHIDLHGVTHHHRQINTLHCEQISGVNSSYTTSGSAQLTVNHDTLLAWRPATPLPKCPCEPISSNQERQDDRSLLATCNQNLPYNQYAGHTAYFGVLNHTLDSLSPIKNALRLDSLNLELMITAIEGECVHLVVSIDSIFSETYMFGCESEEDPGDGPDPPDNRTERKGGRGLLSSGLIPGGYKLVVDLSDVAATLAARPYGTQMSIELSTPTVGGSIAFINGSNAEDLRPRLNIYGEYRKVWEGADYTIAYQHDDNWLTTTTRAKVDDARHTSNKLMQQGITVRRSEAKHNFGAEYRLLSSERTVIEPDTVRIDTVRQVHSGFGAALKSFDAEGDSIRTFYDPAGRPVSTINQDGTSSTIQYMQGKPDSLGITDQEFFGYLDGKIVTNENGVKFAQFADAFGRKRREVADYGDNAHLNLTTKYEYDMLGRLLEVTNPKGQITSYTYDEFGRVLTKTQPDLGTVSYTYDALGNVRFSQDSEQAVKNLVTFTQYDDLNRMTLIGEAYIDTTEQCPLYNEETGIGTCGNGTRLTDKLDGNVMHVVGGSILTANRSMFLSPVFGTNTFQHHSTYQWRNCQLDPESRLGETERTPTPMVMHETANFRPRFGGTGGALIEDFEDIAWHPEFARIAVNYDTLPPLQGAVWYGFPSHAEWDKLAPTGKIRNLRGREGAVAYREKGYEAFHYAVMSYDERGRVEALIHYNENLGFDAVYYRYNSANQVISITVADPWRKFLTWYGYDHQGRIDSVWSMITSPGSGLVRSSGFGDQQYPGHGSNNGLSPIITYSYTKMDMVEKMRYPVIGTLVEYAYNHRKFLDSMATYQAGLPVFSQQLEYDPSGQITAQDYTHYFGGTKRQEYEYDSVQRLTAWTLGGVTESYLYDEIGNRQQVGNSGGPTETYAYTGGTNRLLMREKPGWFGNDTTNLYGYNANGARTNHSITYDTPWFTMQVREELLGYSFRGLLTQAKVRDFENGIPKPWEDWRYRYGAGGEREQKKMFPVLQGVVPAPDSTILPWLYYLLGGDKQQLAVYHGQQLDSLQTDCEDFNKNRVYLYPWEYNVYGAADDGLVTFRHSGSLEYKIVDHLGSTRLLLDDAGNVAGEYDNAPFGAPVAVTGAGTRQTYIGKERDRETVTGNHGLRQYDAEIGGFTSVDPLWEKFSSSTPYHYTLNTPMNFIDDDGEDLKTPRYRNPNWIQRGLNWWYGNEHMNEEYDFRKSLPGNAKITGTEETNRSITHTVLLQGETNVQFSVTFTGSGPEAWANSGLPGPSLSVRAVTPKLLTSSFAIPKALAKLNVKAWKSLGDELMKGIREMAKGNVDGGTGGKSLSGAKGIFYHRTKNGGRIFYRQVKDGLEIIGYANKHTEDQVINQIQQLFSK